jgi:hypothetical protein
VEQSIRPGRDQMNPQILLSLLKNNGHNVQNIINTIGLENLFKLMPDIIAILETLKAEPK